MKRVIRAAMGLGLACLAAPACADGLWRVSLYGGYVSSNDSDVDYLSPAGDRLKFDNVSWESKSFESPPYWGLRIGRWLSEDSRFGIALDYVHAKVIAERHEAVHVSGTRGGLPIDTREPLSTTFNRFEYTDGLNLVTANLLYRFPFGERFEPYLGVGVGAAIPHVEVESGALREWDYQLAGPTAQALAGVSMNVASWAALFAEYRGGYVSLDADVGTGSVEHDLWSNHVAFGLTVKF